MINKITLFTIILLSGTCFSYGQVYQIDAVNGQTITTCKAVFESSGGDPDICFGYNNNETSTVTFCSGTPGRPIRVSFLTWDLETNFDFLYVYDGTSTSATLIGTITGNGDNNNTPLYFTSSGTCLTFKFVSDGFVSACGWEAIIGCSPVSCNGNLPAGDICTAAPQICNLNGYCGNTSGWYTPDHANIGITGSSLFCGSIENNSWISFVAANTTASFSINSANCIYSTSGIQAMILRTSNCNTFQAGSNCVSQSSGSGTFTITTNVALVPGTTYYLMIDGYAGNICDYTITALSGVQLVTITSSAPNNRICSGSTASIISHGGPPGTTYSWSPTGTIIGSTTDSVITVNPTVTTTYTLVATLPNGCATQTVNFTLTVGPKKTTNIPATICEGKSITIGTHTYTQTGNYTDTLRTSIGCDSIVFLNLTVTNKSTTNINKTICQGDSVVIGTQVFMQQGNYSVTLLSANNCDSVVNLTLTVNPNKTTTIPRNICQGETITVGTHTYSQTGNYIDTLHTSLTCDSIVNLILTVSPLKSTDISRTICEGQNVVVGTHTYTQTGNYTDTLATSATCDSIVHLALTVNPKKTTNITTSICTGQTYTIGTQTFGASGNYSVTLLTSLRCDSVVNLFLTVTDSIVVDLPSTICAGKSVTVGTQTFNSTGNYTIYLQAVAGCDSTVNLNLTVVDSVVTNISDTICEGNSVTVGSQTFDETGNYSVILTSSQRCDSIVHLDLTVNPVKSTDIIQTICESESVTVGSQTFTQTGQYDVALNSSQGCDSIVHLDLVVNPKPVIDATSDKLSVKSGDPVQLNVTTGETLSYSWTPVTQVNDPAIQNPTGTLNAPTWFVVIATNSSTSCKTTDSVFVDLDLPPCSKENVFVPNAFSPNGDGINDIFLVRSKNLRSMTLMVYNRWGNKVYEGTDPATGWDGTYKGKPSEQDAYGYYFTGECIQGEKITLKGSITLLR